MPRIPLFGFDGADSVATPDIIVFEKFPYWEPELRRQFLEDEVRVRACRTTADIPPLLNHAGPAVLVLDLEAAPAECLQFLGRRVGRWPSVMTIVVGSRRMAELEWPIRELGTLEFITDYLGGEDLARLCRKQLPPSQQTAKS